MIPFIPPLYLLVLLPIIVGLINYLLFKHIKPITMIIIAIEQAIMLAMAILCIIQLRTQTEIVQVIGHFDPGVGITLKTDAISAVLVLLTVFLFSCFLLYNYHKSYMNRLFLFLFMTLQGLINGLFLSNDLFTIYLIVELSTILVSILVMYKKDSQSVYDGMMYLMINIVSMTFYLMAVAYIYKIFGTLDMTILAERMHLIEDPRIVILPYALIITSVDLKAALMPLFSWLPKAHGTKSAPSIVSAVLSALYVKGGIYLFIRFQNIFSIQLDTHNLFIIMGFMTAVIGFIFAISQTDLKLLLAYSTVSQIGLMVFGLSINTDYSYWGSIYHIVNHAIFKSVLFITSGMIIDAYGTRDIREIKGVYKRMPFVTIISVMAILGITGGPLFNGSISKYFINQGLEGRQWLEYAMIFMNFGTIVAFVKYATMFKGMYTGTKHRTRLNQRIAIGILGFIALTGGIFGVQYIQVLFNITIPISLDGYLQKALLYGISLVTGYLFYHFLYKRITLFAKIREIELSFNQIAFSIVLFFSLLYTYLFITV